MPVVDMERRRVRTNMVEMYLMEMLWDKEVMEVDNEELG